MKTPTPHPSADRLEQIKGCLEDAIDLYEYLDTEWDTDCRMEGETLCCELCRQQGCMKWKLKQARSALALASSTITQTNK